MTKSKRRTENDWRRAHQELRKLEQGCAYWRKKAQDLADLRSQHEYLLISMARQEFYRGVDSVMAELGKHATTLMDQATQIRTFAFATELLDVGQFLFQKKRGQARLLLSIIPAVLTEAEKQAPKDGNGDPMSRPGISATTTHTLRRGSD